MTDWTVDWFCGLCHQPIEPEILKRPSLDGKLYKAMVLEDAAAGVENPKLAHQSCWEQKSAHHWLAGLADKEQP